MNVLLLAMSTCFLQPAANAQLESDILIYDPPTVVRTGGPANLFKCRQPAARQDAVTSGGGSAESEAAVARGLAWLARHQVVDAAKKVGYWPTDGKMPLFDDGKLPQRNSKAVDPNAGGLHDDAGTGLALMAFLGAGKTHKADDDENKEYAQVVEFGLSYLVGVQDKKTGAFSRDLYAHGICTIAICEAYGMTHDHKLKSPAQAALKFIVDTQGSDGGWRDLPKQDGDTSATGWNVSALKAGSLAGLDVPAATFRKVAKFLDKVCDVDTEGYGSVSNADTNPTRTAIGLLCRQSLGWGPKNLRLMKAVQNYPMPNSARAGAKNCYNVYYAAQVMYHIGGDEWKTWNEKNRDMLIADQNKQGAKDFPRVDGSWTPTGDRGHSNVSRRLMATTLNILSLEVYYRYPPRFFSYPE